MLGKSNSFSVSSCRQNHHDLIDRMLTLLECLRYNDLDNLQDGLTKTPLLPTLLNYVPPELVKASRTAVFKAPSRIPEKSGCIVLTEEDGIDMEAELQDTIEKYVLNYEQATVLRSFAHTVVRAPGWSPSSSEPPPILLVHGTFFDNANERLGQHCAWLLTLESVYMLHLGVFGAGKRYEIVKSYRKYWNEKGSARMNYGSNEQPFISFPL